MRPERVLATYWLIVLAADVILYAESLITVSALLFLLLAVLSFTIGVSVSLARRWKQSPMALEPSVPVNRSILVAIIVFGSACNVAAGPIALRATGLSIADVLSFHGLLASANSVSIYRYTHGGLGELAIPALLTVGYTAAFAAPFIRLAKGKHNLLLVLAPALSSLVYASLSTARAGFVFCAAATAGGWIAVTIVKHGAPPRLRWQAVASIVVTAVLVAAVFMSIAILRVGRIDPVAVGAVRDKQVVYALGGLPAFSQWYEQYYWARSERDSRL
jgi:oligosaccharide repeat unit polymerase